MPLDGVSFVVPCYNSQTFIRSTLQSIFLQKPLCKFEVLLIDNNCTDDTVQIASEFNCRVLHEPNQGRSFARNLGIKNAQYEYIAFIDSDVILEADWLERALPILNEFQPDGAEGSIENASIDGSSYFHLYRNFFRGGKFNLENVEADKFPIINSAACIYKKSTLELVGGFDPNLNWFEDADLSKRVFFAGGNLITLSGSHARCYFVGGISAYIRRKFNTGVLGLPYYQKWHPEHHENVSNVVKGTVLRKFPVKDYPSTRFKFFAFTFFYFLSVVALFGHYYGKFRYHPRSANSPLPEKNLSSDIHFVKSEQFLVLRNAQTAQMFILEGATANAVFGQLFSANVTPDKELESVLAELKSALTKS